HNTFYMPGGSPTHGLFYSNSMGGTNTYIVNNIFVTGTTASYPLYLATSLSGGGGQQVNHNIYYNLSGALGNLLYRNGTTYKGTACLHDTTGGDSSLNYLPVFGSTDLQLEDRCSARSGAAYLLPAVPTDIYG